MIITYYGKQFFKLQFGDTTIAYNPVSKKSQLKSAKTAKFGANIAVVGMNHYDFNGIESVTYNGNDPFVIAGPGEYEINGVLVRGFLTKSQYGKEEKNNTIYLITLEGMNLCFLGGLHDLEIPKEVLSELDNVDVLFVPIGGGEVLTADQAHKMATKLEAKVIIPMDYDGAEDKDALKKFLKETGSDNGKPKDKLTLKKKDLTEGESEVVVLASQA